MNQLAAVVVQVDIEIAYYSNIHINQLNLRYLQSIKAYKLLKYLRYSFDI